MRGARCLLEITLRDSNVVAWVNEDRCIQRICFFRRAARSPKINLVFIRTVSEAACARDRIEYGQAITIGVFAAFLDLSENVLRSIIGHIDVDTRISDDSFG
jgi:hypothetical protein